MLILMSVFVSDLVAGAGDSLTIVVLVSFFSAGGFVTVVSFCSQAARKTVPIKRQIYLFISIRRELMEIYLRSGCRSRG